jgi:hypothetical protein
MWQVGEAKSRKGKGAFMGTISLGRAALLTLFIALAPAAAQAQAPFFDTEALRGVGWHGFLDWQYLLESFGSLVLATALGALIAFHPMTPRTVDTLEEAELPKVHIMYSLVGAVVGVTVLQYGMVVGLVVFGLGGLMRFRTNTATTRDTGRLILVTLIGLIAGLNLPHFAVLAALFAFVLIYVFDAHPTCRLVVDELPGKRTAQAAEYYRTILRNSDCKLLHERTDVARRRFEAVFRMPRKTSRAQIDLAMEQQVPSEFRGQPSWQID